MSEEDTKQYLSRLLSELDFSIFDWRYSQIVNKVSTLKTDKGKKKYLIESYAIYIQLLEIFFIFTATLSMPNVYSASASLAWDRNQINRFINDHLLKNDKYYKYIIEKLIYGIKQKENIPHYRLSKKQYSNIIREGAHDFIKDYDFINAYKHGYRVVASTGAELSINGHHLVKTDFSIRFLAIKNKTKLNAGSKGGYIISEKSIYMNSHRHMVKIRFILNALINMQAIYRMRNGLSKKLRIISVWIDDEKKWNESLPSIRLHKEVIHIDRLS